MHRRTLEPTRPARLFLLALRIGMLLQIVAGLAFIYAGIKHDVAGAAPLGAILIILYPILWAYLIVIPLLLGRELMAKPREKRAISRSDTAFGSHKALKIAVAGSYGKTTMKELLTTVLSEGLSVAATPANKNVSISHARFAAKLTGKEDVLVIEYGEGEPGDVALRAAHPSDPYVITGLAPAHLDRYKTVHAAGEDIFTVAGYLKGRHVYVNGESPTLSRFLKIPTNSLTGMVRWGGA